MEPSAEEGFTQLLRLQETLRGYRDAAPMRAALQAYNGLQASTWRRCDGVAMAARADCGDVTTTEASCKASGCCWWPTSTACWFPLRPA